MSGILLGAPPVQHRRQVGAAAEPRLGGDDEAGVHVHGRHMRIAQVRDQRNARRPEPGIVGRARNLRAEFGRELAMHGGTVHADLLEQPPAHHRHHAAAAGLAGVVGAVPGRAHEAPGVAGIERSRRIVFQPLEGRADVVAQGLEPGSRAASCESCSIRSDIHRARDGCRRSHSPAARNTCSSRCNCRGER